VYRETNRDLGSVGHEQTLDDFTEVTKVERIVTLGRCRQQLCGDGVVDINARLYDLV